MDAWRQSVVFFIIIKFQLGPTRSFRTFTLAVLEEMPAQHKVNRVADEGQNMITKAHVLKSMDSCSVLCKHRVHHQIMQKLKQIAL